VASNALLRRSSGWAPGRGGASAATCSSPARALSALARGVGGDKVVAAGLARLLQQVRDIGQPMAAEIGLTAQLEGLLEGLTEEEVTTD
jgi:hypothetical protein